MPVNCQRDDNYNIQSRGFQASRDLSVRRPSAYWIKCPGPCKTMIWLVFGSCKTYIYFFTTTLGLRYCQPFGFWICIFLDENYCIWTKFSFVFVPGSLIDNKVSICSCNASVSSSAKINMTMVKITLMTTYSFLDIWLCCLSCKQSAGSNNSNPRIGQVPATQQSNGTKYMRLWCQKQVSRA